MSVKNTKFSKKDLQKELLRLVDVLNKVPTRVEFIKLNKVESCYKSSFSLVYSSYNDLLEDCGLPVRKRKPKSALSLNCKGCNKPIIVRDREGQTNYFCSSSCSATHNNKNRRKKVLNTCNNCGGEHKSSAAQCSYKCRIEYNAKNTTLGECLTSGGNQQKFSNIRGMARSYSKYLPNKNMCQNCGYDKHTEIAHIKSIPSFGMSTLVWEVNHENNLLALCRNCHWEFDKGELSIDSIKNSNYYNH